MKKYRVLVPVHSLMNFYVTAESPAQARMKIMEASIKELQEMEPEEASDPWWEDVENLLSPIVVAERGPDGNWEEIWSEEGKVDYLVSAIEQVVVTKSIRAEPGLAPKQVAKLALEDTCDWKSQMPLDYKSMEVEMPDGSTVEVGDEDDVKDWSKPAVEEKALVEALEDVVASQLTDASKEDGNG